MRKLYSSFLCTTEVINLFSNLTAASKEHTEYMAKNDIVEIKGPDSSTFSSRASKNGFKITNGAQMAGAGQIYQNPEKIVNKYTSGIIIQQV
jgi:uncharacterized protein YkwD